MPTAIRAAVGRAPHESYQLEDLQLDDPQPDEVLVRIAAVGVCHTDVIVRDQLYPLPQPIVGGHEGAGVVERVGPMVRGIEPGDHVVLADLNCGVCRLCRTGAPSYCLDFTALNFSGACADGSHTVSVPGSGETVNASVFGQSSFATHALANMRNTVVMPREAPLRLLGPLGCGIQTGAGAVLNAVPPEAGSRIVVYGVGAVGCSALLAAKLVGCSPIIVVEPRKSRRALAERLGADVVIDPGAEDPVEAVRRETGGEGAGYAFECSGEPEPFRQAVDSTTQCGETALFGADPMGTEVAIDVSALLFGRRIRGVVEGSSVPQEFIPRLWRLREAGLLPFDQLYRYYDFADLDTAFRDAYVEGAAIKPVLVVDPELAPAV